MQQSSKRVLYITNVNMDGPYLQGVIIKINGQLKAFSKNGFETDLLYTGNDNKIVLSPHSGKGQLFKGGRSYSQHGFLSKLFSHIRIAWYGSINFKDCAASLIGNRYDAVYLRFYMPGRDLIQFLYRLKKACPTLKILLEYPTLNAATEFKRRDWPSRISYYLNRKRIDKLNNQADFIITLTQDKTLFGKPALFMANGIELDGINPVPAPPFSQELVILGVASDCAFYHGFDKVIRGLGNYKAGRPDIKVRFRLITNPMSRQVDYLKTLAREEGVEELVQFELPMSRSQLAEVYKEVHMGMGTLAMHRINMTDNFSLKHREYAAFGLPFIMSLGDSYFENSPFVLTVERDDNPIDMEKLVKFYIRIRAVNPAYTYEFRKQMEPHITWENQLREVFHEINRG